jgi:hypothetical protein
MRTRFSSDRTASCARILWRNRLSSFRLGSVRVARAPDGGEHVGNFSL